MKKIILLLYLLQTAYGMELSPAQSPQREEIIKLREKIVQENVHVAAQQNQIRVLQANIAKLEREKRAQYDAFKQLSLRLLSATSLTIQDETVKHLLHKTVSLAHTIAVPLAAESSFKRGVLEGITFISKWIIERVTPIITQKIRAYFYNRYVPNKSITYTNSGYNNYLRILLPIPKQ